MTHYLCEKNPDGVYEVVKTIPVLHRVKVEIDGKPVGGFAGGRRRRFGHLNPFDGMRWPTFDESSFRETPR